MKDACEGNKASDQFKGIWALLIKLVAVFIICLFIACSSSNNNESDYIYMQDGLIYKQGQSDPYTGKVLDTLQSKIIEYGVLNGKRHGEFQVSTLEGIPSIYGFVENNKNIGLWNYFYDNGAIESRGNFRNDLPHGKWTWFYKNGKVRSEGYFINGREVGRWKSFNEKGTLISITTYYDGQKTSELIVSTQQKI